MGVFPFFPRFPAFFRFPPRVVPRVPVFSTAPPPPGGGSGCGTVFKVAAAGTGTVVHAFSPCTDEPSAPDAPLIPGFDGNLYGTTSTTCAGGSALYKVTPAGAVSVVHTFNAATE